MEEQWTVAEAAAQYLGFGITVVEGHHADVPKAAFSAALQRMLSDLAARKLVRAFVPRCVTPQLLWGPPALEGNRIRLPGGSPQRYARGDRPRLGQAR